MKTTKRWKHHKELVYRVTETIPKTSGKFHLHKKTVSNLFRYSGQVREKGVAIDLSRFNQPIEIDIKNKTLDVQGLTTNETIAEYTLQFGLLPYVIPGFKHITIGGSIVGIGFESTSFRRGYVHDGLVEAEVLLADGTVIVCTADNEYSDLFHALPNSFGTLGYILRAKIRLRHAAPYVTLHTRRFSNVDEYLDTLKETSGDSTIDYIESVVYRRNELYITTGRDTGRVESTKSIYGSNIFYKEISRPGTICLSTKEYLFRYDPEWFWGLPEGWQYTVFHVVAPKWLRNSRMYSRYFSWKQNRTALDSDVEELIQDWVVSWKDAKDFFEYALDNFDLNGKPWMPTPIRTHFDATMYPLVAGELYFNLGSYTFVKKIPNQVPFYSTKILDEICFSKGGIKMLYSTSFMKREAFDRVFNGTQYQELKQRYDPNRHLLDLYKKTVLH